MFDKRQFIIKIPFTILMILFLVSCASEQHYKPQTTYIRVGMELDDIPDFKSFKEISLINSQKSNNEILFVTQNRYKWYANLNEVTDMAIDKAQIELVEHGMKVKNSANKKLYLSINFLRTTTGNWAFRSYTSLSVKTGDGDTFVFKGDRGAQYLPHSADAAVYRVISKMLQSREIINYLQK